MTALSRGRGRLRAYLLPLTLIGRFLACAGSGPKAATDVRDLPETLKRDIGLSDGRGGGQKGHAFREVTRRNAEQDGRNWQRHLDRSIFPPV